MKLWPKNLKRNESGVVPSGYNQELLRITQELTKTFSEIYQKSNPQHDTGSGLNVEVHGGGELALSEVTLKGPGAESFARIYSAILHSAGAEEIIRQPLDKNDRIVHFMLNRNDRPDFIENLGTFSTRMQMDGSKRNLETMMALGDQIKAITSPQNHTEYYLRPNIQRPDKVHYEISIETDDTQFIHRLQQLHESFLGFSQSKAQLAIQPASTDKHPHKYAIKPSGPQGLALLSNMVKKEMTEQQPSKGHWL